MLKIGRKENDVQIKEVLDNNYIDITSVSMWFGVVEKYGFDKTEAGNQIELFITSLNGTIDNHNQVWYDEYKLNGIN